MNPRAELEAAKRQLASAEAKVRELEEREKFEESFHTTGSVYVLTRHSIDRGTMERIEGVFSTKDEAIRYANGLPAYGIGADLIVTGYPFYV